MLPSLTSSQLALVPDRPDSWMGQCAAAGAALEGVHPRRKAGGDPTLNSALESAAGCALESGQFILAADRKPRRGFQAWKVRFKRTGFVASVSAASPGGAENRSAAWRGTRPAHLVRSNPAWAEKRIAPGRTRGPDVEAAPARSPDGVFCNGLRTQLAGRLQASARSVSRL